VPQITLLSARVQKRVAWAMSSLVGVVSTRAGVILQGAVKPKA